MMSVNPLAPEAAAALRVELPEAPSNRFAHNVLWNLLGAGAPMIVSFFSIPILIRALGPSRFGALTIITPILGYAGVLDLGLSRALTKLMAERIARGRGVEVPELFWTGAALTLGCGLVFGVALAVSASWLAHSALNISVEMQAEVQHALYLFALGLTVAVAANAFRGTLEALGRFDLSNAVRVLSGILLAGGPLIVLPFSHSLAAIVGALVAVRSAAWLAQFVICLLVIPGVAATRPRCRHVRALSSFGGWVTISNGVGQLLYYCDRFAVGRLLTMSAVAYLTTPQEISVQLLVIPNAICAVLFPLFAKEFAGSANRSVDMMKKGARYVFLLMFPISLALVIFARPGLTIWLGAQFAEQSAVVLCWCAVALLFSATALVPFAAIQAAHRPDIPSKVYLVEAGLYILVLWWLVRLFGIRGAALAFALRTVIEASAFWTAAQRLAPASELIQDFVILLGPPTLILLAGAFAPINAASKATLCTIAFGNWLVVLHQSDIVRQFRRHMRSKLTF